MNILEILIKEQKEFKLLLENDPSIEGAKIVSPARETLKRYSTGDLSKKTPLPFKQIKTRTMEETMEIIQKMMAMQQQQQAQQTQEDPTQDGTGNTVNSAAQPQQQDKYTRN